MDKIWHRKGLTKLPSGFNLSGKIETCNTKANGLKKQSDIPILPKHFPELLGEVPLSNNAEVFIGLFVFCFLLQPVAIWTSLVLSVVIYGFMGKLSRKSIPALGVGNPGGIHWTDRCQEETWSSQQPARALLCSLAAV